MNKERVWHGLNQRINPVGFGCWQLAGEYYVEGKPQGWGRMGSQNAIKLVEYALSVGIQLFDTAQGYGNGRSEKLVGKALKNSREANNAVICTKISFEEDHYLSFNENILRNKLESSLRNLQPPAHRLFEHKGHSIV